MSVVELLGKVGLNKEVAVSIGGLKRHSEIVKTAQDVLVRFAGFGGEGWLCATDSKEIRRFSPAAPLPELKDCWPLCAEAGKGDESLHLARGAEGWILTTLRRALGEDGVLVASSLMAKDGKGWLCYETAWESTTAAGQRQLRPAVFRFTGFKAER